jgi:hypothetical protein
MVINALATTSAPIGLAKPDIPNNDVIKSSWALAEYAAKSNIARQKNPHDAFFIIMYGYELGISPMAALRTIYSVNGVPTCSGEAMLALIRKSGLAEKISMESDEKQAKVYMKRRDTGEDYTAIFTKDDAKNAGLLGKDTWQKYPRKMMLWRAISEAAKVLFGDVIGGLYTTEEIAPDSQFNEAGEPVGKIIISNPDGDSQPPQKPAPQPDPVTDAEFEEGPVLPAWVTTANVQVVVELIKKDTGANDAEIIQLAGINALDDLVGWGKWNSGKEAALTVIDAWKAAQKPAGSKAAPPEKWNTDNDLKFREDIRAIYMMGADELAKLIDVSDWQKVFPTPVAALEHAHNQAVKKQIPMVSYKVNYRKTSNGGRAFEFITPKLTFTLFGAREKTVEMLGEQGKLLEADAKLNMAKWEPGNSYDIPNGILIVWKRQGELLQIDSLAMAEPYEVPAAEGEKHVAFDEIN